MDVPLVQGDSISDGTIKAILEQEEDPVIFEYGACDGWNTREMLAWCCSRPFFVALEPDPRNWHFIEEKGLHQQVVFLKAAGGDVTGFVPFYLGPLDHNKLSGCSSTSPWKEQAQEYKMKQEGEIQVMCYRLDDLCQVLQVRHISLLWADVQGAERLIIKGGANMLPKTKYMHLEYDGGRCYEHSSSFEDLCAALPGWHCVKRYPSDALFANSALVP